MKEFKSETPFCATHQLYRAAPVKKKDMVEINNYVEVFESAGIPQLLVLVLIPNEFGSSGR